MRLQGCATPMGGHNGAAMTPQLPRRRWALFSVLCVCFFSFVVRAHDPGLSTMTLQLGTNHLEILITMAVRDAELLTALDTNHDGEVNGEELTAGAAELKKQTGGAIELQADGRVVKAGEVQFLFDDGGNANAYLKYSAGKFTNLVVRSLWLARWPAGHRQMFTLTNPKGETLTERMLTQGDDAVTIGLNAPLQEQGAAKTGGNGAEQLRRNILIGAFGLVGVLVAVWMMRRMRGGGKSAE